MLSALETSVLIQVLKVGGSEAPEAAEHDHAWRALLDNFPHPVAQFDRQLRHVYANHATELATGIPASDFIGKKMRDLGHPEPIARQIEENVAKCFSSAEARTLQLIFDGPAGTVAYECRFVPHLDAGEVARVMVISRDVTEMMKARV
ncbi:MAG TPA: PAS domain-containing protein [Candidatus Angelobacter sp.]|jgi:PAS domain S-box-containing protein|nr:PAS domain-containing protein [Candidatus Angelobacter sp.]